MKMFFLILVIFIFCVIQLQAQTSGILSVSVTTSSTGGNYAPRNIVAIWLEDTSGKFVKTLLAYAATRKQHLNTWETSTTTAGSIYNVVDALTGATQNSHGTRTCSWSGTDYTQKLVADGDYKLRMELTDKNGTGNIASFTFTKGPNAQKLTPANVPSFTAISLNWATTVTGISPEITKSNTFVVYPNPGTGLYTVLGVPFRSLEVADLSGKIVCKSLTPVFNLTAQPKGIYLVTIRTERGSVVQKIIRK